MLTPTADDYFPPSDTGEGTGLTVLVDFGEPITLTFSNPADDDPITPGLLLPLVLDGSNSYDQNIVGCNGQGNALGAGDRDRPHCDGSGDH